MVLFFAKMLGHYRDAQRVFTTTCDKSLVIAFFFFSNLSLWHGRTTRHALTRSGNTKKSASEFEGAFVVTSLEAVTGAQLSQIG